MSVYFRYDAIDISGKPREGNLTALDEAAAVKQLKAQGFQSIRLEETEPPKPPMPLKKKLGIGVALLLLLALVGYALVQILFGPPSMAAVYARQDQAFKDKNFGALFEDFEEIYLRFDLAGRKQHMRKSKAIRELTERSKEEGHNTIFHRKSKVLRERMLGSDYVVVVEQETFQGTTRGLGAKKFRQTVAYQWRRNGLGWKIYVVHIKESQRF